jgi:transposase
VLKLKRFARGLIKAKDGIQAYYKHRITSAKIESFNNTIQKVLYKTCGISNMRYFFLKRRQISLQT